MSYPGIGTSGQVDTAKGVGNSSTFQDVSTGSYSPGYQSGWYYTPYVVHFASSSTRTISSSFFYAQLIFFREEVTIDQITFEITSAATGGSEMRVGRYNNVAGRPTTLAENFGEVASDATGETTIGSLSSTIPAGYSWIVWQAENNVTLRANTPTHMTNQLPSSSLTSRADTICTMFNFSGSVWANGFTDLSATTPGNTGQNFNVQFRIA